MQIALERGKQAELSAKAHNSSAHFEAAKPFLEQNSTKNAMIDIQSVRTEAFRQGPKCPSRSYVHVGE